MTMDKKCPTTDHSKHQSKEIRFFEDGSSMTSSKKGLPTPVVDPAYNVYER